MSLEHFVCLRGKIVRRKKRQQQPKKEKKKGLLVICESEFLPSVDLRSRKDVVG